MSSQESAFAVESAARAETSLLRCARWPVPKLDPLGSHRPGRRESERVETPLHDGQLKRPASAISSKPALLKKRACVLRPYREIRSRRKLTFMRGNLMIARSNNVENTLLPDNTSPFGAEDSLCCAKDSLLQPRGTCEVRGFLGAKRMF